MRGFLTRGQPTAMAAASTMLASGVPHALLLAGPAGVGKTTLALDIATGLLCVNTDREIRPCRSCRACRALAHGNHPDLHLLAPGGAGAVIGMGGSDQRGVRELIAELALMPVEGGARVAIVEAAERMTDDAQSALLKTLEEPPAGTVLILCAEDDERLLPTIRSRCVRIRLGPVPARAIEEILADRDVADAPTAARVGRLSGGRPGVALALAAAPDAVRIRGEIARTLLDLLDQPRTGRLLGVRDLAARAAELGRAMQPDRPPARSGTGSKRSAAASTHSDAATPDADGGVAAEATAPEATAAATRVPAAERRAAALALVDIWRDVVRDVALVGLASPGRTRDPELLEDLETAQRRLPIETAGMQLRALEIAGERLEGNVSPELVLDALALAWGR